MKKYNLIKCIVCEYQVVSENLETHCLGCGSSVAIVEKDLSEYTAEILKKHAQKETQPINYQKISSINNFLNNLNLAETLNSV